MANSTLLQIILMLVTVFTFCSAQMGAQIYSPLANDTIRPGQKVDIAYGYQNMGNGSYTVDFDLWQDSALTELAKAIDSNVSVASGNSAGTKLEFYVNSTYSWTVPHGLNSTVYLTVTAKSRLAYSNVDLKMRSRGIMLHVNAGLQNLPMHQLAFLAISVGVLAFIGL